MKALLKADAALRSPCHPYSESHWGHAQQGPSIVWKDRRSGSPVSSALSRGLSWVPSIGPGMSNQCPLTPQEASLSGRMASLKGSTWLAFKS